MKVSGRCFCGAAQFSGDADPMFQAKCYCTDCRKLSGSGHAAMMAFPAEAIAFTGKLTDFQSTADSGSRVTRSFCPTCGTGLRATNANMPGMVFLRASTLDEPNLFSPQMIVWAARAPVWDPVNPGVKAFAERPTGF